MGQDVLESSGLAPILDSLRPTYQQELEALPQTYAEALGADLEKLERVVARLGSGPASFIASGGMMAVASLAAQLHEQACLEPAIPMTPLAAISRPSLTTSGAILFTSSGKHPDAKEVMRRLGRPGMRPAAVLTHRASESLPSLADVEVVTLPPLPLKEGFLAVNSVLSMCVAIIRCYLGDVLPKKLPELDKCDRLPSTIDRLLLLHPPSLVSAAVDLETRLVEVGLAAVQVADLRNFAHGRHTGLAANSSRTAVLALSDAGSRELTEATIRALPTELPISRWHTEKQWPESVLPHLVMSMYACGSLGTANHVNVGRPRVPAYGRKLYRLPMRRKLPENLVGPIERKLRGVGGIPTSTNIRSNYQAALNQWIEEVGQQRFGALALDYDGTVCSTYRRFDPPSDSLVQAIVKLLEQGMIIGFASGRGQSLPGDLRKVIPKDFWDQVEIGMYNGGVLSRLSDDLEDLRTPSSLIRSVEERLNDLPIVENLCLTPRRDQLTVEQAGGAWLKEGLLVELVSDAITRPPAIDVKVVASGHSVDVVPMSSSKVAVVERLKEVTGYSEVLCIGDQGQIGGNDFELLACQKWTLSVDRASADPGRCWFLGDGSVAGPDLLHRYLKALSKRRTGFAFKAKGFL